MWISVLCMRSNAWLAARVSLRLARLPHTASSAQRSRRLRYTRAAAPVLLAHAEVTKIIIFFQWVQNLGTQRHQRQHILCKCKEQASTCHCRCLGHRSHQAVTLTFRLKTTHENVLSVRSRVVPVQPHRWAYSLKNSKYCKLITEVVP